MYSIEWKDLPSGQLQQQALAILEEICDEFHFQDDFGILSLSIHEILDRIIGYETGKDSCTDLSFYVSYEEVSLRIHHSEPLTPLKEELKNNPKGDNPALLALRLLVDESDFSSEDQDLTLLFHVKSKPIRKEGVQVVALKSSAVKEKEKRKAP